MMTTQNAVQSLDAMIDGVAEAAARRFALALRTKLDLSLPMGGEAHSQTPSAAQQTPQLPAIRRGRPPKAEVTKCANADCPRPARSKGLCSAHYQKQLREKAAKGKGKAVQTTAKPGKPPKAVKVKAKKRTKKASAPTAGAASAS